jgi:anti-sigma factor RsiW
MTRCDFHLETLSAYVDGELRAEQELEVRRHLDRCDRCHHLVETMLQMNETIASVCEVHTVPRELRKCIKQLALAKPHRPRTFLWAAFALVPVLLVAVGIGLRARWSEGAAVDRLAHALIEDHERYLKIAGAIQVASNEPQRIAEAFQNRVGFAIRLPELGEASLLGARFCWIKNNTALLSFYETQGQRFSIFAIDQNALPRNAVKGVRCRTFGHYEVCLLRAAPELLAMVGGQRETKAILPEFERFGAARSVPPAREKHASHSQ